MTSKEARSQGKQASTASGSGQGERKTRVIATPGCFCDESELPVADLWCRSAVDELDIPNEDLLAVGLALLAQAEKDGIDLDAPAEPNRKQDQ